MPGKPIAQQSKYTEIDSKTPAWEGVMGINIKALTTTGKVIIGWIPHEKTEKDKKYFCHGYSLKTWKQYGYTIFSDVHVQTVLREEYVEVMRNEIQKDDVVSFHTCDHIITHSCRIKIAKGEYLQSMVRTKNGIYPLKDCTLQQVWGEYPLAVTLKFWRSVDKFEINFDD